VKTYITGATGRLGRSILEQVDAIPLVRKPSGLPNEIVADFKEASLKKILKDAECILHIAGSIKTWDKKALEDGNVELTRKIVECSPKDCHIVFAGSITVYGKKLAEIPANEETPPNTDSDYSRTKLEAENLVKKKKSNCILRIGIIYGPEFQDYPVILRMMEKGKMKIFGNGKNRISFVHVDDIAAVIPKAMETNGTFVVSGPAATQEQIYSYATNALGVPAPTKHVSPGIARLFARLEELKEKPKITREHIAVLSADRAFDYSKARAELGFSPRPIKRGLEEIVSEYISRKGSNK